MEDPASAEPRIGSDPPPPGPERLAVIAGFILLVAVGALLLVSGLIMPLWAVAILGVLWVAALLFAIRVRARPVLVLVLPFVMLALWLIAAWAGDTFLDWTA